MIYFDHAATSYPKPQRVLDAVSECIKLCGGNPGRGGHSLALRASEVVYGCREEIADLLHVKPEQIVFTPNATLALNLAIRTRAKKGSRILLSDQEHNATLRVIYALADAAMIEYDIFPSIQCSEESIEKTLRPDTDILVCNLTSNVTGNTVLLKTLLSVAKRNKLYLILDASQWMGHHEIPHDICEADAICAPGHKGLYGIQGSGFVYLKNAEALPPFIYGGSGIESKRRSMPEKAPERFEAGTLSTPAIASLCAGIKFIREIGISEIEAHERELVSRCREMLAQFKEIKIYGREDGGGSLLSFSHQRFASDFLADALDRYGICARGGFHCAPLAHASQIGVPDGALRVSFGITNSLRELDSFYTALCKILK